MTHRERAKEYFTEGYNCAQAVFIAFCPEMGLDQETAARLASSFGGGMGRLREVCGAVSGMFMALGMIRGYSDPEDQEQKAAQYELVQELAQRFQEKNNSIICRELLGLEQQKDDPEPSVRTAAYYSQRPCAELVADAAEILEKKLQELGNL